ncbi:MAG TPA: class I SAM-dependent DNA methyltransferase [Gaiellaceae bacterium]|nr:class I SAM-dependent DNA methyltransferase [Gaiellaceae bacterium]
MSVNGNGLVQKLWNYCNVLRDDGLSYQDYLEQLTYLLFLKMADEQTKPPFNGRRFVPEGLDWASLLARDGEELEAHYIHLLRELGHQEGMLGVVFRGAQNRIQDPAKLRRLIVELIDKERWMSLDVDVKGDAYEGLLQRNAEDLKSGAGQYFTPRPLIDGIVEVMRPEVGMTICDPACGTGGFLLAAYAWIVRNSPPLDPDQRRHLQFEALKGWEIVESAARLCVMNLLLHGIGAEDAPSPIEVDDALRGDPGDRFDMVLTNPPFGRKSSLMFVNAAGESEREDLTVVRDDFWASTSNKQLNFLQHVKTLVRPGGRAAIVVPDNVLFEGGAGETIRRKLLDECDVHTLLRLPTGLFYAQGVKANVLFFDRKPPREEPWTKELWIYDLRTNQHFTLKQNPLRREHLDEFVEVYKPEKRSGREESERFKRFTYDELLARDKVSLDITWLRDESLEDVDNLPPPEVIAQEIVEDLEAALAEFSAIAESLAQRGKAVVSDDVVTVRRQAETDRRYE